MPAGNLTFEVPRHELSVRALDAHRDDFILQLLASRFGIWGELRDSFLVPQCTSYRQGLFQGLLSLPHALTGRGARILGILTTLDIPCYLPPVFICILVSSLAMTLTEQAFFSSSHQAQTA